MKSKEDIFYQAMRARDHRFDGKFFIGVKTTHIYCRPICPAQPKRENVEFFTHSLLAEKAGYRPCLRCRPESAPLSSAWVGKSAVVQRALRLIAQQDLYESNEDTFAEKLGISARHLRRLFLDELGKTPKQIADHRRLDFSRSLLVETGLPITDIAFTAGFSSIRRFNDAIKTRFHRTPTDLRKKNVLKKNRSKNSKVMNDEGIHLTLPYRPPLDWHSLLHFFQSHLITGIETVSEQTYERVFKIGSSLGALRVQADEGKHELKLQVLTEEDQNLFRVVQKIRQMLDLDSDPLLIANSFSDSKPLARLNELNPGLRVPRGWDPFETSICAILGQLVSTEQATKLIQQLVQNYGEKVTNPFSGEPAFLFPIAKELAMNPLNLLRTTQARKNTIREFSQQLLDGKIKLEPTQDPNQFQESLLQIKGIGPWTASYINLRALGDPDAFPHTDLILKRATQLHPDLNLDAVRPWRAYAAMYLWKEYAQPLSKKIVRERKNP